MPTFLRTGDWVRQISCPVPGRKLNNLPPEGRS
jgi:hypothetical protein